VTPEQRTILIRIGNNLEERKEVQERIETINIRGQQMLERKAELQTTRDELDAQLEADLALLRA
jgi:hypothetical protein